jgi:acyl-coenzyme A thioesterase PaaI-like protein
MSDASTQPTPTDPLNEARARAGQAIRDIGHAFIGRQATIEQVNRLADDLEAVSAELWPAEVRIRAFIDDDSARRTHPQGRFESGFDDRPISGRSSPWGLDLEFHRHGDEIEAFVTLRSAHEGAPGRCHGGIVAAMFDDVYGYVLNTLAAPAFTGEITVRYLAPTPLHRRLACRARFEERQGRKIMMSATLTDVESGTVVATSRTTFIAVDPAVFDRPTAQRPAPPDEDV